MRAPTVPIALLVLSVLTVACGDDGATAPALDSTGNNGGGGSVGPLTPLCQDYCTAIVTKGTNCEHYNDGNRCISICGFYMSGGCADTYQTYAQCMTNATNLSCFLASSGKWGVDIYECNPEFDAFNRCIEEKDAGVCPY